MAIRSLIPAPAAFLALCAGLTAPSRLTAQTRVGQASVRGVVVTQDSQPVFLAQIELRVRRDSLPVRSTQSNESGRFQFDGISEGVYHLVIRRIGFGPATTPDFTVVAAQVRDVGRIRLQAAAVRLDPIEVTVERPDITFEPTRTGYLAEALTTAAGGVINDALRELPDVVVELDGTIRLRGNTPAIYVNGKPAPMEGMSLTLFMEQFPVDRIERIEILDAPPARFSAEGGAGIINIVLKQGVELGMTGSLNFAAGTRGQYTAGGRATLHRGRTTFNGGLDTRWSDSRSSDFTLRQNLLADPVTFLQQDTRSDRSSRNANLNFDFRYELSKKSQLSARVNGSLNGNDRDGRTGTAHLDELQDITLAYDRLARQEGDGKSGEARIGYQHSWVPDRHTFQVDISARKNRNENLTNEETLADAIYQGDDLLPAWLTRRQDGSNSSTIAIEAGYQRPLGKQLQLEAGSDIRRTSSREDQTVSLFEAPGTVTPDEEEFRRISRVQWVSAAYLSLQRRLGKFGIAAGVRAEWVDEDIRFPLGDQVDRRDANLFPNINLSWNPRQRMGVRLSWGRRVNRPGVSVLDPTDRSTDPLNRSVGNPGIAPSTTNSINAGFNWTGRLGQVSFGPYWSRTANGWERVTTVDANGVSTSTWENLTLRTNIGTSLSLTPPRYKEWVLRLNLSASKSHLSGTLRPPGAEDGKLRWSVGGNLAGPVIRGIGAQGNFGYEPGRDLVQGRTSGQWRADFNFRYRMANNRTTIGLSVQDPFELRKTTQQIRDPSVIQTAQNRVTTRSMTVNVAYAIGGGRGSGPSPVRRD